MSLSRRAFLLTGAAGAVLASSRMPAYGAEAGPERLARDEAHWARIAAQYDMTDRVINLENGNWGVMSRPVLAAYKAHTERVNRENSFYARRQYGADYRNVLELVADRIGAAPDEVALTRGATEALQNIIGGFDRLSPGDRVLYADLDYGSVQMAMESLARRHGCEAVQVAIPEPATRDGLVDFYADAMDANARVKLLLLTHVSHRTGLLLPVKEICAEARKRGIRTVVDVAHSWGQVPFSVADIGADYIGYNLHKWIGAPIGVGILYIRRDRLSDIRPNLSATPGETDSVYGRVHTGTSNFAAFLTVPEAIAFHEKIGPENKAARLRYLRDLWVEQAREIPSLQVLTPDVPALHAGITAFRFEGITSAEANQRIAEHLYEEFGIFTVHRTGIAAGACVRVTPNVYNSGADVMRLAEALNATAPQAAAGAFGR